MEPTPEPSSSIPIKRMIPRSVNEKKIIIRVFHCLARDQPRGKDELVDMCADYTGVSKSTVYKMLREVKVYGEVQPPKIKTGRKKLELDEDAKCAIRRTVQKFFLKNEIPTLDKLLEAFSSEEIIPKMCKETLRKHLRVMNLNFGERDRKRPRLCASPVSISAKPLCNPIVCTLCLKVIQLNDDAVVDDTAYDPKLCESCNEAMLVSYEFKNKWQKRALSSKDKINREAKPNITSKEKLCRMCQLSIDQEALIVFKCKDNFTQTFNKCLILDTLSDDKSEVACKKWFDSSRNNFTVVNTCSDTKPQIRTNEALPFMLNSDVKSELPDGPENAIIKENEAETKCPFVKTDEIENENKAIDPVENEPRVRLNENSTFNSFQLDTNTLLEKLLSTNPIQTASSKLDLVKKRVETRGIGVQVNVRDVVEYINVSIQVGVSTEIESKPMVANEVTCLPKLVNATTSVGGDSDTEKSKTTKRTFQEVFLSEFLS